MFQWKALDSLNTVNEWMEIINDLFIDTFIGIVVAVTTRHLDDRLMIGINLYFFIIIASSMILQSRRLLISHIKTWTQSIASLWWSLCVFYQEMCIWVIGHVSWPWCCRCFYCCYQINRIERVPLLIRSVLIGTDLLCCHGYSASLCLLPDSQLSLMMSLPKQFNTTTDCLFLLPCRIWRRCCRSLRTQGTSCTRSCMLALLSCCSAFLLPSSLTLCTTGRSVPSALIRV